METYMYDANKRSLTFFRNNKPIGGMIGKIAEKKHREISTVANTLKRLVNGKRK